jgi:hypothetical protein
VLFSFLKSITRRAQAKTTADHIAQAIDFGSGRFFLDGNNRAISKAVLDDEFVLSYLYGAILFSIELVGEREEESVGYITWEVYERLFPGNGKSVLGTCNVKLEKGNQSFKSGVKTGYEEMKGIHDRPGVALLWSLRDHLLKLQKQIAQTGT